METARSYLYVPGDQPDKLDKAASLGADAIIIDLEDAVRLQAKPIAREHARAALTKASVSVQWWVRVNPQSLIEDVTAVAVRRLAGVVLPKADVASARRAAQVLTSAEDEQGLGRGSLRILALVETASGLHGAIDLASQERVTRLGLGEADLAGELGLQPGPLREELWPLRSQIVVASTIAGILAPVGPVETNLYDDELIGVTTQTLLRQGFRARTAIHPRQLRVINDAFTPSHEQVATARDVLDRLREAERSGSGVAITDAGTLIDAAVARTAREVLSRAAFKVRNSTIRETEKDQ